MKRWLAGLRRRVLLLWLSVVLVLAAAMVVLFYFSAAFTVDSVEVTGAREEVADSALERAEIPLGTPLARVSQRRVNERVLEDPRIAEVSLERDWPSQVRLVLTEREAAVAVRGAGATWLADEDGVLFEEVDDPADDVPLIRLRSDPADLDRDTVTGLSQMWLTKPDLDDLGEEPLEPRVDRQGSIEMEVGVVTILWGEPVENQKKWGVVAALLAQETIDPLGPLEMTIDVRVPDAPVVTGLPEATG